MKYSFLTLFILLLGMASCNDKDNNEDSIACDFTTIISAEEYANAPSNHVEINSLKIDHNCMRINFSASGCSGDSWEVKLIDSGVITESATPKRTLKLSIKNEELCNAYISKELTFDISNLQVRGHQVILEITNSNKEIFYQY